MIEIYESYDSEIDILFNGSKSKLLYYKGRSSSCNVMQSFSMAHEAVVQLSEKVV